MIINHVGRHRRKAWTRASTCPSERVRVRLEFCQSKKMEKEMKVRFDWWRLDLVTRSHQDAPFFLLCIFKFSFPFRDD